MPWRNRQENRFLPECPLACLVYRDLAVSRELAAPAPDPAPDPGPSIRVIASRIPRGPGGFGGGGRFGGGTPSGAW